MCKDEEEKDLLEMLQKVNEGQSTPKNIQITNESIEKLIKRKNPIFCKDGVAKIDSNHPDYEFWMED
ncbi:hypothetical protein J8TS2_02710 [Lederbergia ruris]|uniref:Uncharacterized protein n=1 Tax=Lederbergia ruris TaxID=217495 RepID=A0ABQ4KF72_9BACI|nr:hypothetical protein J8TS2_02710 [Lederbergia ruris]